MIIIQKNEYIPPNCGGEAGEGVDFRVKGPVKKGEKKKYSTYAKKSFLCIKRGIFT